MKLHDLTVPLYESDSIYALPDDVQQGVMRKIVDDVRWLAGKSRYNNSRAADLHHDGIDQDAVISSWEAAGAPLPEMDGYSFKPAGEPYNEWLRGYVMGPEHSKLKKSLGEAPIGDFELIGKWGDQERPHSFRDPKDRALLQSRKAVQKIRQRFGQTEHVLNFYFVNLPGAAKHSEEGIVTHDWLESNLPKAWQLIQAKQQETKPDDQNSINVIWVTNQGVNKVPMTAWILAHRLGHAIQASNRGGSPQNPRIYYWQEAEKELERLIKEIFKEVYGWDYTMARDPRWEQGGWGDGRRSFWSDTTVARFFEHIGTMRSARQRNLGGRPYEFLYELFAQYITTGSIKFNPLPQSFGLRGQGGFGVRDEEAREHYDNYLSDMAYMLGEYFDTALYNVTGHYLVM